MPKGHCAVQRSVTLGYFYLSSSSLKPESMDAILEQQCLIRVVRVRIIIQLHNPRAGNV